MRSPLKRRARKGAKAQAGGAQAPATSAAAAPARGYLDRLVGDTAHGWALDPAAEATHVEFAVDGEPVGTAPCDLFRHDLERAGIPGGIGGFEFRVPQERMTGLPQSLSARIVSNGLALKNSPMRFRSAPADAAPAGEAVELLANPALEGLALDEAFLPGGRSELAPHVRASVNAQAAGVTTIRSTRARGFPFTRTQTLADGLALYSPVTSALVRLFLAIAAPPYALVSPGALSFRLKVKGEPLAEGLTVRIGRKEGLKVHPFFQRKVTGPVGEWSEIYIDVPAETLALVTAYPRKEGADSFEVVFQFAGKVDVEIAGITLLTAPVRPAPRAAKDGTHAPAIGFEDDSIAAQWDGPALRAPRRPEPTTWRTATIYADVPEVVVPVFNGIGHVAQCLDALSRATTMPFLLTVVDDGSDGEVVEAVAQHIAPSPWMRHIVHSRNHGYTVAINRAIKASRGDPVVILNSDTIVTPGWLERLVRCLAASPDTGIAGPLTNAGSWQSVPAVKEGDAWAVNELAPGMEPDDMARLLASVSRAGYPEVPILNGFCLAIRRAVFDGVGLFDEITFPAGYGEENDLCLRAREAGWRLRVADDVYVYHHKSRSFGSERRAALSKRSNAALRARWGEAVFKALTAEMEGQPELRGLRERLAQKLKAETA